MSMSAGTDRAAGVVITGAARGIGGAIATVLAEQGWQVVGIDLDDERLRATISGLPGSGHSAVPGDVADEAVLQRACEQGATAPRGLRGFVANAGIARPGASVDYSLEDWDLLLRVNLTAPFLGARTARRHMGDGGSMVMISSINSLVGMGGRASYCAAKSGVNGLVRALAVEWAPDRVRVNAVSPGTILTEMAQEFVASGHATFEGFAARVPMGHSGEPSDIAGAVAYLLSDVASYVTGVVLPVDGGWAVNGMSSDKQVGAASGART